MNTIHCKRCGVILKRSKTQLCARCMTLVYMKNKRQQMKKEKRCINCFKKIRPVLIYRIRCKKCNKKVNNYIKNTKVKPKSGNIHLNNPAI